MEKAQAFSVENFICNWNSEFPDYVLTPADLQNPHALMGALFQIFDRLGIDRDAVLAPSEEENGNEHIVYYLDLLPVINMTRVIRHLVSLMPQVYTVTISDFLQPTATTSQSILLLLFNLMIFNEQREKNIAPYEKELFAKAEEVKALENHKNKLLEMLNQQAEEKGKRSERLQKIDHDIKVFEEELKQERELYEEEKLQLDSIVKENKQFEQLLDQKKAQLDSLTAELERKRALRVYDAEDIKSQAQKAAKDVEEAEKKLESLKETLMQKETNLKNLQTIKPNLDTANTLLHEIMKLSEDIKDFKSGDLDLESKEGELDVLKTELSELNAQLGDLQAARGDAATKRQESQAKRQEEKTLALSALRDAEEKDKKCRDRCKKAMERTEQIKQLTIQYEADKAKGLEELASIQTGFTNELKSVEDLLMKKMVEAEKRVSQKLRNRNL